jgi:hypothetical protein
MTQNEVVEFINNYPGDVMEIVCTNCGKRYGYHTGLTCVVKAVAQKTEFHPETSNEINPNYLFKLKRK